MTNREGSEMSARSQLPRKLFACGVLLIASGCGAARNYTASMSTPQQAVAAAVPPPAGAPAACEVELHIQQLHEETPPGTEDIDMGKIGVSAVEGATEGICIKRAGHPIKLPEPIILRTKEFSLGDKNRFCRAGTVSSSGGLEMCEWTGRFHAARPFTFTFYSTAPLADYLQLLQFWRNGDLVYRWRPAPASTTRKLVVKGQSLTVSSTLVAASLPPHRSDFDLRIFPAGVEIDSARLEQQAVDEERRRREHWAQVKDLAIGTLLAAVDPQLRQEVECYLWTLDSLQADVQRIVDAGVALPVQPHADCTVPPLPGPGAGGSLVDLYQASKDATADALKQQEQAILDRLETAAGPFGVQVRNAAVAVAGKINARIAALPVGAPEGTVQNLKDLLKRTDELAVRALGAVDDTRALARSLRAEAVRLGQDHEKQVEAYTQFAKGLAEKRSIFDPRADNPAPVDRELSLDMEYGDRYQAYLLNAWFAVPVRLFGNAGADLEPSLAIPMVDVIGLRWQFGRSRLSDLRWGLLGFAAFTEPEEAFGGSEDSSKAAFSLHTSLGFGTLQFGAAYVVTDNDYYSGRRERRFRLLVGLDLVKLITGENAELL